MRCEAVHIVSDADFGYWNSEKWGEPSVQEIPCTSPAVATARDPLDGTVVHLCATCGDQA